MKTKRVVRSISLVQTVSPNPILCISGWNLIWITDCPHSISQLSISDLCVHKRFFVFTECALVSMVMPLRCYAYAKNNSNSNTVCNTDVLPSRLRCSIIFRLVRQWQTCRKLEYAALFRAAISAIFLFFFWSPLTLLSKHKEVRVLAVYCFFPLDLHFATTQACFCKDVQHVFCKNVWRVYVAWGREKAMLNPIWPSRLKRISRNAIWIGFQTTYECSSKRIW